MNPQRGYTLVELMIALAITGVITTVLGLVVQQIFTVPEQNNGKIAATHAVQNAGHWVGLDGQTATGATGGSSLTLALADNSTVSYILYGDELHRVCGSSNRTIARNISSASFSVTGNMITMDIESTPSSRWNVSENGTYQVCMRSTG
jgi:prepilin-type N-terminal cleavage/methylation domain-containing protein